MPAPSTIGEIFRRHGLLRPRRRRRVALPTTQPFGACTQPNDLWCTDFKGHFPVGDGLRCHPLTISDAMSRFLVRCDGVTSPDEPTVRPIFESAFREFGLPNAMRSDNGPPFASTALGRLSRLSVWWIRLGIRLERIEPGHPEQNGRHERMHRTLKQETASPPEVNLSRQQRSFDRFRHRYNDERPHEALGQVTPASVYAPSPRPFPNKLPELDYPTNTSGVESSATAPFAGEATPCFSPNASTTRPWAFRKSISIAGSSTSEASCSASSKTEAQSRG
jgi:transposase InsO family protein